MSAVAKSEVNFLDLVMLFSLGPTDTAREYRKRRARRSAEVADQDHLGTGVAVRHHQLPVRGPVVAGDETFLEVRELGGGRAAQRLHENIQHAVYPLSEGET